jgi:hypothetical protein
MNKRRISNPEMVALVVFDLGGSESIVRTSDIAVEVWKRAHDRFSIEGHPEYPDTAKTHNALRDAKKIIHGELINGDAQKGWTMTQQGMIWSESVATTEVGERSQDQLSKDVARMVSRLRGTQTYSDWSEGRKFADRFGVANALELPADVPVQILIERLRRLSNSTSGSGDEVGDQFISWLIEILGRDN